MDIELKKRLIFRGFVRYLRRSGYDSKTVGINLRSIFHRWIALPTWRHMYDIDSLLPHEWDSIEEAVVGVLRQSWEAKGQKTLQENKKRAKKHANEAKQLRFQF